MVIDKARTFFASLPDSCTLLGLDIGTKTIGLALSNTRWSIANPLDTIQRTKFSRDLELLQAYIQEHHVGGLVIGLPLHLDGSEGKKCQSVRQFARNLLKKFDIPILFQDERLTTMMAEETLEKSNLPPQKKKQHIDKIAASYILQIALDTQLPSS